MGETALSTAPATPPLADSRDRTRRGAALVALAAAALAFHAALLGGLEWTWRAPAAPMRALQVRSVVAAQLPGPATSARDAPLAEASVSEVPESRHAAHPDRSAGRRPAPPAERSTERPDGLPTELRTERPTEPTAERPKERTGRGKPSRRAVLAAVAPISSGAAVAPRASVLSAPTLAEAPDRPSTTVASEAATVDQEPIPVYRTRIPPAATLRYAIRRGSAQGSGELQWRPTASGYSARLDASIGAGTVYSQRSEGAFDAAGLAPGRYTDRGPRRQLLAANFQRESGKVSFSGSSAAFPLLPGSQDRLTWLVQLAAVLAAEPERLAVDAIVAMAVVGVRGEPMTWVFRSTGPDPVATDAGEVTAIRLVRESRGPYDPGIEIWIDPQRHHLPVKVRFGSDSEARTLEMVLQSLALEP